MSTLTVRKLDHTGRQVAVYPGHVIRRTNDVIVLRTTWQRPERDLGFVTLERSSHWIEFFFPGRRYNIFEVHDVAGRLQGWYCNFTRPPHVTDDEIAAEDLALDLWVTPAGETRVLDEDEFEALPIDADERRATREALADVLERAERRDPPFGRGSDRD